MKKKDKEPLTVSIPSQGKNMMKVGERREEANANDEYEKGAGKRVSLLPYFIVCVVFLFLSQTTSKVESLSLSLLLLLLFSFVVVVVVENSR